MWHLQLVPRTPSFRFMRLRNFMLIVSGVLLLGSVASLGVRGLNFGIDFRGGILMEVGFPETADLPALRTQLGAMELGDVSLQTFGEPTDVLIRIGQPEVRAEDITAATAAAEAAATATEEGEEDSSAAATDEEAEEESDDSANDTANDNVKDHEIVARVRAELGEDAEFRRVEVVGPQVSGELVRAGASAILIAVILMLVYIWLRFEWQFSLGAVLALVHDVLITLGVFSVLQLDFNLSILAALLTIVGYSMNDTVVIYDRVREMLRKYKRMPLLDLLDLSLNSTFARTLMTSLTTLLALFSLYFLGGEVIRGFTFAMIFGVIIGTYSSIFVACPLLNRLGVKRDWSGLAPEKA